MSVVVFISFYAYYVGYLSYFGITNFKFTFDFDLILQAWYNNIIKFSVIIIFLFILTNLYSRLDFVLNNQNTVFIKRLYYFLIFVLFILVPGLLLYFYFFTEVNKLPILLVAILLIILLPVFSIRYFFTKNKAVVRLEDYTELMKLFDSDMEKISIFIFCVFSFPLTFYIVGLNNFNLGQLWTVYKDNSPECIVLIKDQNFIYCAPFNRESKEIEKKYRLIPLDELKNGYFKEEELGLMKVR